jgi:hypothetical protein
MDQLWELFHEALPEAVGGLITAAILAFIATAYSGYGLFAAILAAVGVVVKEPRDIEINRGVLLAKQC